MEENQLAPQSQEPQDKGCLNCGNPAVLHEFPTKLCTECREKFIRFPVPKWIWAFAGGIGLVVLFALFSFSGNLSTGIALERGKKAERQHKYMTAQREFEKVTAALPGYLEGQGRLMIAAFNNLDFAAFRKAYSALEHQAIPDQELYKELDDVITKSGYYFQSDSMQQLRSRYDSLGIPVPDALLRKYLQQNTDDLGSLMVYNSELFDKEQYAACDSISHVILEKYPGFNSVLLLMASVKRQMGNYDSALYYCNKLIELNNEYAPAIASKARTYLKMKKDDEAMKLALQAYEMDRKDGFCIATLAIAYHFKNDIKKRDELVNKIKADSTMTTYLQFALDIFSKKEKFRD
jgi:tetratricopeptide (TPR) repeat protein